MRFDGRPETLETLREISENILDPVFLVDRGFNVWYANRAFEHAVGVRMSSSKYKDRPCHELLGLTICKDACVMKQAVAQNKTVRLAEIAGKVASGDLKNFHINAVPVTNAEGQPFGSLIFLRDITVETQIHEKYKQLVAKNSSMSLSGQLEGNLIDVIQLLNFLQKNGQLTLQRANDEGYILFERGQMVKSAVGNARGVKAVDYLFGWADGQFSFSPKVTVEIEGRIEGSADFLLMDIVRERDEIGARQKDLPAGDAVLEIQRVIGPEEQALAGAPFALFEQLVQGQPLPQAFSALPYTDTHLALSLLKLRDAGVVKW
jgi:PAS domain S-box-containing protein